MDPSLCVHFRLPCIPSLSYPMDQCWAHYPSLPGLQRLPQQSLSWGVGEDSTRSRRGRFIVYALYNSLMQCRNYSNGWITGSLCKPLCVTKEIQFQRCLGHGVKLHVLQAVWNGNIIIIKSPKALGSRLAKIHLEDSGKDVKLTRKEFIAQVREAAISNVLRSFNTGIHSLGTFIFCHSNMY